MSLLLGIDVGSTTVKVAAVEPASGRIVWRDYRRHETRQAEVLQSMLEALEAQTGLVPDTCRAYLTGSGGQALAEAVGARFVQEVHAISLAVEASHPDVRSVIELGGQNAKVIVFTDQSPGGPRRKIPSMNDRCASGTGAVIDKIAVKLGLSPADVATLAYRDVRLHPVAAKCGVFAETDINSLQKLGVPRGELMASLFDAIVLQNLAVLTRGQTLQPRVLLLGGPHRFIRGLREAWQANIPRVWAERGVKLPEGVEPSDLITVPPDAEYFGAIGAARHGGDEDLAPLRYAGPRGLAQYRASEREASGLPTAPGLVASRDEFEAFAARFAPPPFAPPRFASGQSVSGFIGIDGGSTSTKGVVISPDGDVLARSYVLSKGNPVEDTIRIIGDLRGQIEHDGARLDVLGMGTTGYARALLRDVFSADVAIVETVAHAEAARRFYDDPQVIVDVGGQDIKLLVLRDGRVVDFKLNTQCSAGNGFFLQMTAESFGVALEEYAGTAFSAEVMPVFGYGCAIFLQTDIVNLQRLGWRPPEILAGLATVLPKNVFLYVAKEPNLARLGSRFVLQGATQRNLAVVKAEVDFIRASFADSGVEPHIVVHRHCGECGAFGAAIEAERLWRQGHRTTFIGLDATEHVRYRTTRNEDTRCAFCHNACLRTFIDVYTGAAAAGPADADGSRVQLEPGERRLIVASCERGAVERLDQMRSIKKEIDAIKAANPNLVSLAAREVWKPQRPPRVADPRPPRAWSPRTKRRAALMDRRARLRIGIPRVLHFYSCAPLFSAYFESLGVAPAHLVYSNVTSGELYRSGCSRGAIDPCFPAKVALAHVHNLLSVKHRQHPLDCLFFPMFDVLRSPVIGALDCYGCPTAVVTPETVKAAFTKENDVFAEHRVSYVSPLLDLSHRRLFAYQMLEAWSPILGLSPEENDRAIDEGFRALDRYEAMLRRKGRETLDRLVAERRLGIVVLGRPYHHDEGVNHGIPEALQKVGYPILSQSTLPTDEDVLDELFGDEVRAGVIAHPLDVSDVWKNTTSASTNLKLWAAKFTARHPNLVAVELSSFKCGHDAPVYSVIEEIFDCAGTPHFAFKDLDENRSLGSIALRVETIDYFLRRYREAWLRGQTEAAAVWREVAACERHAAGSGAEVAAV